MSTQSPWLTYDSLATLIAWISTCMLAAGLSLLLSDDTLWICTLWGSFGLIAALGLDIAARMKAKKRYEDAVQIVQGRFEKGMEGVENVIKHNRRSTDPR